MRDFSLIFALVLVPLLLHADKQSLESLKARADTASGGQQVEACTEIAERQMKAADAAYEQGKAEEAQAALGDVVNYGVKAAKLAAASGKRMKQTEIALRRIGQRLEIIGKTLDSDDRPPVDDAVQKLDSARTDLLQTMFRK